MSDDDLVQGLIDAFRCLPGVGQRTAQRMAWHLLERDRGGGTRLADTLGAAMLKVGNCQRCRNFTSETLCAVCGSASRQSAQLCVVESPADVAALEQAGSYRGYYFVTMGCLSPIDGIGPDDIGMAQLQERCREGISEVIVALGATVEGEATAHYIVELLAPMDINLTRLAQGIPVGGNLEYVDGNTLAHALAGRKPIE